MSQMAERALSPSLRDDGFAASVLEGLSRPTKTLPCRYFYDAVGSSLFEEITRQPEYYPTRTEIAILRSYAGQMLGEACAEDVLVEFGSGSSVKTEILVRHMRGLRAYVSIDVSESALLETKRRLISRFPALDVRQVLGDFSHPFKLPAEFEERPKLGFFPGSTIGNFTPAEAASLLRMMRAILSPDGRLFVGVDLKKDIRHLLPAYNDEGGVTAAFNLNLLARINRDLEGTFDLRAFRHEAVFEPLEGRIAMRLISTKEQVAGIPGASFYFRAGEAIHTENAYKYSVDQFREVARSGGWAPQRVWTDELGWFSVHELISPTSYEK
ncbi:L-histidine N(alpha)-methyltransferase [Methylocystis sp. JAN1]|uniref:L-histidine N(alpha)-methyltransferase n=1 Tax=Methylocystis sp. JAN1 TaxID=3397211 RepID=UPI003FA21E1B